MNNSTLVYRLITNPYLDVFDRTVLGYIILGLDGEIVKCDMIGSKEKSEYDIIHSLLSFIWSDEQSNTRYVTFDGRRNDFPVLFRRAAICGIDANDFSRVLPLSEYVHSEYYMKSIHIDLFSRWLANEYFGASMIPAISPDGIIIDLAKKFFDYTSELSLHPEMFGQSDYKAIVKDAVDKAKITGLLYVRMAGFLY